ncbi:MAG: SBBP repeat-containing protein [Pirellulaceae bacterium]
MTLMTLGLVQQACCGSLPSTEFSWLRQFGPADDTSARGVAANARGDVFVSSTTNNQGSQKDIALSKYDSSGTLQWNIAAVTNTSDANNGIAADGLGNSYIASTTDLSLNGPNSGQEDAFVRKYDSAGDVVWTRQVGGMDRDFGTASAVNDRGDVFLTGYTTSDLVGTKHVGWDGFLAKYDTSGAQQWVRQFGSDLDDYGTGIAADNFGNVFVVGTTDGSFGGTNLFLGREDVFVAKYDASGTEVWTRQFGTSGIDFAENLTLDTQGNVYITGTTTGKLGEDVFGGEDGFIGRLDAEGNVIWLRQFGTSKNENPIGIAYDGMGHVYVAGRTLGSFAGPNQGNYDAFIATFDSNGMLCELTSGSRLWKNGSRNSRTTLPWRPCF